MRSGIRRVALLTVALALVTMVFAGGASASVGSAQVTDDATTQPTVDAPPDGVPDVPVDTPDQGVDTSSCDCDGFDPS